MAINKKQIKRHLEAHEFGELFNQLGWDWPESDTPYPAPVGEKLFNLKPVANKRGFVAYHCPVIPDSATRAKIETRLSRDVREHIIIFTDEETQKQRWQWVRRVPGQPLSRKEHEYHPNQPMLLIEKIGYLEVPMEEEDGIDLIDVFDKVKSAFDIDRVTKKFYERFKKEHDAFLDFIDGITDMGDARWYASVMLNRLMFIYFIQKKGFLDGDTDYLRNRLKQVQELKGSGKFHTFYRYFLMKLCHEVLAKKDRTLDSDLAKLIGKVPYLNGGIFQPHELEEKYKEKIDIPDEAFQTIFDFFDDFEWHLDNRPAANADEINPDVLGYIFEKYINQKQMGAYYTKEDITEYIGKNTIIPCLFDKAQKSCKIAFEGETAVWNLLKADPDRYIYPAVRHGVTYDVHHDIELAEPVPYPDEIAVGLDTSKPDLLERRKKWNTPAPPEAGLPTEIWRETVARRQHYAEIKSKLQRGEVQSINDLITLNLDIRQFAQDVIERCESPDLLNAFWTAIAGYVPASGSNKKAVAPLTVLDPTCGSGAFLFAALNILEPLYEACLERMKGFLEEWESSATVPVAGTGGTPMLHSKHPNYAKFFQSIRDEIGRHPSPKYFIYKSIIIHNLYGVDIMKEAVEICKLRLFLKLVAQVEDGAKIEPLPDIDFNIRAGNTLVGFATEQEMKDFFDRESKGQALLQFDSRLDEVKEAAEEVEVRFNLFRQCQLSPDEQVDKNPLPAAKQALHDELNALNERLNQYLAQDYGIDPVKPKKLKAFLETHQPFHWFIEFYGIIKTGGFDAIIGNPPYVEYSKVRKEYQIKGYALEETGNLFSICTERFVTLQKEQKSYLGIIVPISAVSTPRMQPMLDLFSKNMSFTFASNYAVRPGKLFNGVDMNLTVFIACRGAADSSLIFTTGYQRWYEECRETLFGIIHYQKLPPAPKGVFSKVSENESSAVFKKATEQKISFGVLEATAGHSEPIYYHSGGRYYRKCLKQKLSNEYKPLRVPHGYEDIVICLLSSSFYYLVWIAVSDTFHVTKGDVGILTLPDSLSGDERFVELSSRLLANLWKNAERRNRNRADGSTREEVNFRIGKSKPIIDEIDKVLAEHYDFTEEELDYIINYDIKYRMGKDLQEDGSED